MDSHTTFESGLKYKPEYAWPEKSSERDCPVCKDSLELVENKNNYYGKPWWCAPCQWQYSEEDFQEEQEK